MKWTFITLLLILNLLIMNKKFSTLLACALVAGSFSFVTNATDEIPYRTQAVLDRKSTRLNSSHTRPSRMPSSA